jgi:hypothetical protein
LVRSCFHESKVADDLKVVNLPKKIPILLVHLNSGLPLPYH